MLWNGLLIIFSRGTSSHTVGSHDGNVHDVGAHKQLDNESKDLFLPYRCFLTRKGISCNEVVLENMDIAKALTEYISATAVEILVVGASTRGGLVRFMTADVPSSMSKGAPDFCTIYVISKGKISSVRSATAPVPAKISPHFQMQQHEASHISQIKEEVEAEMRRLKLELKQTMDMYSTACKEALTAKQKVQTSEILLDPRYSIEAIEEATDYFSASRKIREGGYGPVYLCELDHTPVAVKVLRPAAQGEAQFHQEVLLLGACPEYGCLHYPLAVLFKVGAFITLQMRHIMDA